MNSDHDLLCLVDAIYKASLDPRGWFEFASEFRRMTRAERVNVAMVTPDLLGGEGLEIYTVGGDPSTDRAYDEYYWQSDPHTSWVVEHLPQIPPGMVGPGIQVMSVQSLMKTEYFNDWVKPQGLGARSCAGIIDPKCLTMVGVFMPSSFTGLPDGEVALLRRAMPHIINSYKLSRRIGRVEFERDAVAQSLNHVPHGVFVLDDQGNLISANDVGQAQLNEGDGLRFESGRGLFATERSAQCEFDRLLKVALEASRDALNATTSGGVMRLTRSSGLRPLELLIAPLPIAERAFNRLYGAVVVIVSDPEQIHETMPETLRRLYGLTRVEAEVAIALLQGCSTREVSDEIGISINTVRGYIRRLLFKMGCRRQQDLIQLMIRGVAGLSF